MGQRQWYKVIRNPDGSRGTELVVEDVPDEVLAAEANQAAVLDRARRALVANAAYLAVAAPTNAQVVAQVRRLTQQSNALIRLAVADFTSADGTE
ncbi:hypothetical protein GCM10010124_26130 [Pilimelia terevasa]|uniref:Uncharacterized protein n=1 Tax=Pilimelia terevasa TaxID=53372 RepID=A0A8J3BQU9_9ACTN|nr:hypothetical protein [Pilimelia terevasa]GGK32129.1 hypothetical protein GCM10010124_26130 [Pilimelia terevasa]